MKSASHDEVLQFTGKQIGLLVALLLALFLLGGMLSFFFEPEIKQFSLFVSENFGFLGLLALVFYADSFISPTPPDLILFIIAKGPMAENWIPYVSAISIISWVAGQFGYWLGTQIIKANWAPRWLKALPYKNRGPIKRFGPLFIALGALTPLPFSFTCWSAGFLKMKYKRFLVASLLRIPRIYLAYLVISYSDIFSGL